MFKITLFILSLVFLFGCDSGPLSSPSTGDLMTPTHAYEIDTWGSNSEIYEFTPKSNPYMTCIMFMLDSGKAMDVECFRKP